MLSMNIRNSSLDVTKRKEFLNSMISAGRMQHTLNNVTAIQGPRAGNNTTTAGVQGMSKKCDNEMANTPKRQYVDVVGLQSKQARGGAYLDYMGYIQKVGEPIESGNHNKNRTIQRVVEIKNLNGNHTEFTMWSEMAIGFDKKAAEEIEKPVIIAMSSCRVSDFR
ncbi:hypothetical protein Tco_1419113, partial [Tanacetum coccineum]